MKELSTGTYVTPRSFVENGHRLWRDTPTGPQQATVIQATENATPTMRHGLSEEVIGNPISAEEAYQGSMQGMLSQEIGSYIAATFLAGTGQMVRWEGQLYEVGNNYIVIYQPEQSRFVVGDTNSLRFVEFSENGHPSSVSGGPYNSGNPPASW